MKIINTEKFPILSWCNNPEESALNQAKNLANLPFLFKHVCLMPDVHSGYGMPIGGVIACIDTIIPNAVGVDIGCGMCSIKTSLTDIEFKKLLRIKEKIYKAIPVGFNHHKRAQKSELISSGLESLETGFIAKKETKDLFFQLGTLGGGNHFIEIQKGDDGHIWFTIHSGSRNLGKKIADYHNRIAINLNERIKSKVPLKWQLAHLLLDSNEGKNYFEEMNFALDFAKENRKMMSFRIKEIMNDELSADFMAEVNIHHNYAKSELHFNKNVVVHRKGATSAKVNEPGIIPGSQVTHTYITSGLGNKDSFMSSSHGAGRVMGRNEAIRSLNFEEEVRGLEAKGILHSIRRKKDLDEAPSAYKVLDQVMKEQEDLTQIKVKLLPLLVLKG